MYSSLNGHSGVVETLLQNGATLDKCDKVSIIYLECTQVFKYQTTTADLSISCVNTHKGKTCVRNYKCTGKCEKSAFLFICPQGHSTIYALATPTSFHSQSSKKNTNLVHAQGTCTNDQLISTLFSVENNPTFTKSLPVHAKNFILLCFCCLHERVRGRGCCFFILDSFLMKTDVDSNYYCIHDSFQPQTPPSLLFFKFFGLQYSFLQNVSESPQARNCSNVPPTLGNLFVCMIDELYN